MNKSHEVEYCNLELRFDRRQIQNLIRDLIQEGYSLYWSENGCLFSHIGSKRSQAREASVSKGSQPLQNCWGLHY